MLRITPSRARRALLAALATAATATAAPACSLVVDASSDQCRVDEDCRGIGAGLACVKGLCTPPSGCKTNAECASLGEYHVCNKTSGKCAKLTSEDCTTVHGEWQDDEALLVGSLVPTTGPDETTGKAIENAITMAIDEFAQTANGLPPRPGHAGRRQIALVGCSDGSDSDVAVRAARHLSEDVGVPAIIGAAFSGITIKVATTVTIPAGTLIMSPSATSKAITDLDDKNLVWRTSPSDVFQADALALYVPKVEVAVRNELSMTPTDKIKLVILHKGDAYGSGLAEALQKKLVINGKPAIDTANDGFYERIDYGNPDDPTGPDPPKFGAAVAQALALEPHVILLFGTNEGVVNVFQPIEQQWPGTVTYRPRWLLSDGGLISELWGFVAADSALRLRVAGSVPGTDNLLFKSFRANYSTRFKDGTSPDVFGSAGGYDALYLLAYAAVASAAKPVSGLALAEGLTKTIPPGGLVEVGSDAINGAFPALSQGKNIDFAGASGPLDFDVSTGEAPSDIQIWCMPKDGMGKATSGISSGLYYDALSKTLKGAFGPACN